MLERESIRLREILLAQRDISPLLDLGSSDAGFRERTKPHIARELFAPLKAAGVTVVHADRRTGAGVDISGDILDPAFRERLRAQRFSCVLIANMLEHVRDRAAVTAACEDIAGPGGLILASVPASFPYHADPLDTGYRPTPAALAREFTGSDLLHGEEVAGETYAQRLAARGESPVAAALRTVLWTLAFPFRPNSARARLSRWRWFGRPYRVSIALVRVKAS